MKPQFRIVLAIVTLLAVMLGCTRRAETPTGAVDPSPSPAASNAAVNPITLPVLDALLADEPFRSELRSRLQLTDQQIEELRKISTAAVTRLRQTNAENQAGDAEVARQSAVEAIRGVIGAEKADQLLVLAGERWSKGGEETLARSPNDTEPVMLAGPNAVPQDTRIVVNIPAFRLDVFDKGTLAKSYRIGIGYPQFPLPVGLRKAQQLIFNPTWTPPNEPWVNSMKVTPGEAIAAGSSMNPLGPIKVPIGLPSLIHGGKPLSKIGTFASHGCVGMTNAQVKDFASLLATVSGTELSTQTMSAYLKNKTKTRAVKLEQLVPVELRYETIVVEDGRLHIYRDVYYQNTNTEENLRAVFSAQGVSYDSLNESEKTQLLEALNAMSRYPRKSVPAATPSPEVKMAKTAAEKKAEAARLKKLRNQKEIVIEITSLSGKGYPAPVNLDAGAGISASTASISSTVKP